MKNLLSIMAATILLASCQKEIDIKLNDADRQLVIDGAVTDEPGPYFVRISQTVSFSAPNTYPGVAGALVIISDNTGLADTLSEASVGVYQTHQIVARPGGTYNLSVALNGKNYYASSSMPTKVPLDSLRFNTLSFPGSDGGVTTTPIFRDPDVAGNNYRFILSVDSERSKSYIVFNDNINNGQINGRPVIDRDLDTKAGAMVSVEMRCIDLGAYNYYYTLAQISGGGPGGGTTLSNPPNNIRGDKALGIFEAYTKQTLIRRVP